MLLGCLNTMLRVFRLLAWYVVQLNKFRLCLANTIIQFSYYHYHQCILLMREAQKIDMSCVTYTFETVHIHGIYMLLYLFLFLFPLLFYVTSIWRPRCFCSIAEFSVDNSVIKPTYMLTYESASELLHLNLEEEIELKILSEAATLRLQWRQQQVILRIINSKESRVLWYIKIRI